MQFGCSWDVHVAGIYDICPRAFHAEKRRFWKGRMNTRIADLFGLYVLEAMPTTQINM